MKPVFKARTASFDVDPQKGFTPLCPDELPVPEGHLIAPELNRQAEFAALRLASKDCHNPSAVWIATTDSPQLSPLPFPNANLRWKRHCEVGTRGHEFIDGLPRPEDYDFIANKGIENDLHPYGACYQDLKEKQSTGVIEFLKAWGVDTVLLGGLATDYCVKTTALQLRRAGLRVVLNLAACRGIAEDSTRAALHEMAQSGVEMIRASAELGAG